MNVRYELKTLIRLVMVVVVAGVISTIIAGPRADAAADGYGVSANDPWHDPSLIEGRSVATKIVALTADD